MSSDNVVLSCIEGSKVSEAVCDYSSWIATSVKAPLKLLHTIQHHTTPSVTDYSGAIGLGSREGLLNELTEAEQNRSRLMVEKGQLMLNNAKARAIEDGVEAPETCQRHGSLVEALIDLEDKIRVLVLGVPAEPREQHSEIGTQLESVIRALHKPILVVKGEYTQPKKVMLAYDGSPACKKALEMVASSPLFKGLPCHIVHVGDNNQDLLNDAAETLKQAGIETQTAQLNGKIEEVLVSYQKDNDIDLMLMGAFSHNRIRDFLLGSFTAKMLHQTNKPLLLLR
ncbi:universal stress protein [Agarilytica rhodophyticola]|uniref:universal stress protein n=1 Tax=Agarilytica rhodophyticola TaxID=1737490 RepID=UPI000B345736|nr:universal stress protein [Agarilytica rhodophyticola]